jgi:hypothetical protein
MAAGAALLIALVGGVLFRSAWQPARPAPCATIC